jgi:hypothetical protein
MYAWENNTDAGARKGCYGFSGIASSVLTPCDDAKNQYLKDNKDVKDAGVDAWIHYLTNGEKENRRWPGTKCGATTGIIVLATCEDAKNQYLKDNKDVKDAGVDAWIHYLTNGEKENRRWPGTKCGATTGIIVLATCEDAKNQYLKDNKDVKAGGMNPWDHYLRHGEKENRRWPGTKC